MRRRLDIAASLVATPELMFLDEPTTGLDPRSRNQVWAIIRALVGAGTTVLLCTQYLDEADQLADGIAVIDQGKVIAEGTPPSSRLRSARRPPHPPARSRAAAARRAGRRQSLACEVHLEPDPAALSAPCASADQAAEVVGELSRAGDLGRELLPRPAEPRRGFPRPDRAHGQGPEGHGETTTEEQDQTSRSSAPPSERFASDEHPETQAPQALALQEPELARLLATSRPPGASALSATLTFGWRGMLKVKHVPEQLIDVTITPVMFAPALHLPVRRRDRRVDRRLPRLRPPGVLVIAVLFTTVYSGVAINTDLTKGVVDRFRSLPIWPSPRSSGPARRQRPLPGRRHRDHRPRPDPRLPARQRRSGSARLGRRSSCSSRSGFPGCSRPWACHAIPERDDERRLHEHLPAHLPQQRLRRAGHPAGGLEAFVNANPISIWSAPAAA